MKAKFENRTDIIRDVKNKAILYTNKEKLLEYKKNQNMINKQNKLSKEVINIKKDIKQIQLCLDEILKYMKENIQNEKSKID